MVAEEEAVVRWLARPEAYPHRPDCVTQIETHISRLFLAGELVYKLKKPVQFDFLNFRTVEAREQACREELRLNRRLAPQAYLRVIAVRRDEAGRFSFDGAGETVDWLVEMRRLPTERSLEALIRRGELKGTDVDRLTETLVAFYAGLSSVGLTAEEYRERYLVHVRDNLKELSGVGHHLPRYVVKRVNGFQLQLLHLDSELFDERVARGKIVDGHGDLRPEHICLSEPIAIFDCIEFSSEFRQIDVTDELAFLAAECDFLGAEWVGPLLLAAYEAQSGDRIEPQLLSFYRAYRACVRAKVAALRADQLSGEAQGTAAQEATRHLALADRYVADWLRPVVLVVGGVAGTGKTTLARALGEALGAEVLRTDVVRQKMASEAAGGGNENAKYSDDARQRVYEELLQRAVDVHAERVAVVLDGTFAQLSAIRQAWELGRDTQSLFLAIECSCRTEVAHARIRQRLAEGSDASEARPEVHDQQRAEWEAWPEELPQIRVDTEEPLPRQVERVMEALRLRFRQ